MSARPLITVVIPTRSRASLLRQALQSVLRQTFDDFEVLVSNNNSTDDTAEVVQELAHPKLKYISTPETLSMPDHYEFILDHVSGQYVTYLGDDDALAPSCLERAAVEIRTTPNGIVSWSRASYNHPNWLEEEKRNSGTLSHYSGLTERRDAAQTLERLYQLRRHNILPLITNSLFPMDLVMALRSEGGRFFAHPAPDFTSVAPILAAVSQFTLIDLPLMVAGRAAQGIGAGQSFHSPAAATFEREFKRNIYPDLPVQVTATNNVIAQSLIEAKRRWPARLDRYDLDWTRYFLMVRENLDSLAKNGIDVRQHRRDLQRAMVERYPAANRSFQVRAYEVVRSAKAIARTTIERLPVARRLEARLRPLTTKSTLKGSEAGFASILEFSARLPDGFVR